MPPPRVAAHYLTRNGTTHTVLYYRTPAGRWRVVDAAGEEVIIVETLTGFDDRLSQAKALASDYASEQQAFHNGQRLDNPLPRLRPTGTEPLEEVVWAA